MNAALFLFVFAGLFSPGPNVILLTASGARFGFRASVPHLLGVVLGTGLIAGLTSYGIGAFLEQLPQLKLFLMGVSTLWIIWMAWLLFKSNPTHAQGKGRPFTFPEAVVFQAINPKIWAIGITASIAYPTGNGPVFEALYLGLTFSGINLFVCMFWTYFGTLLATLLSSRRAWAIFRNIMALLLVASAGLIWI